ncbi:MAG: adenylate/guanylate cyclase domain-containing protein [Myxococcales bacterium]|nr:adenylate/guanylate cyclase domain-containing protein [Myxococcales bacterium]
MATNDQAVHDFWEGCESGSEAPSEPVARALRAAHDAVLRLELDAAREALDQSQSALGVGPWEDIRALLVLRVRIAGAKRDEVEAARQSLATFAASPDLDRATAARAHHQMAVASIRAGDLLPAEEHLLQALDGMTGVGRVWVLDGMGQVLRGLGAFREARRTWTAVLDRKRSSGDALGVAITAGNLARLEFELDNVQAAAALSRDILTRHTAELPLYTTMRHRTLLLEALVTSSQDSQELASVRDALAREHSEASVGHPLRGYAAVALARAAARLGQGGVTELLDEAQEALSYDAQRGLVEYWRRELVASTETQEAWFERVRPHFDASPMVFEPEVRAYVRTAEAAARRGDLFRARALLESADARVEASNNPGLRHLLDESAVRIDPAGMPERLIRRYAGADMTSLAETRRVDNTIVFADLVSFTQRSNELTPEEVMDTARSVFELSSEVLKRHANMPLSYLGDGLLAHATGPDHGPRGVAFACDFTKRCDNVTRVRQALWGDEPLPLRFQMNVRCGVATGPVVLGTLGSLAKLEFAAIGMTTNRAARLQGQAEPNQVVADAAIGGTWMASATRESYRLKGIDGDVEAGRIQVV